MDFYVEGGHDSSPEVGHEAIAVVGDGRTGDPEPLDPAQEGFDTLGRACFLHGKTFDPP